MLAVIATGPKTKSMKKRTKSAIVLLLCVLSVHAFAVGKINYDIVDPPNQIGTGNYNRALNAEDMNGDGKVDVDGTSILINTILN